MAELRKWRIEILTNGYNEYESEMEHFSDYYLDGTPPDFPEKLTESEIDRILRFSLDSTPGDVRFFKENTIVID